MTDAIFSTLSHTDKLTQTTDTAQLLLQFDNNIIMKSANLTNIQSSSEKIDFKSTLTRTRLTVFKEVMNKVVTIV